MLWPDAARGVNPSSASTPNFHPPMAVDGRQQSAAPFHEILNVHRCVAQLVSLFDRASSSLKHRCIAGMTRDIKLISEPAARCFSAGASPAIIAHPRSRPPLSTEARAAFGRAFRLEEFPAPLGRALSFPGWKTLEGYDIY